MAPSHEEFLKKIKNKIHDNNKTWKFRLDDSEMNKCLFDWNEFLVGEKKQNFHEFKYAIRVKISNSLIKKKVFAFVLPAIFFRKIVSKWFKMAALWIL